MRDPMGRRTGMRHDICDECPDAEACDHAMTDAERKMAELFGTSSVTEIHPRDFVSQLWRMAWATTVLYGLALAIMGTGILFAVWLFGLARTLITDILH